MLQRHDDSCGRRLPTANVAVNRIRVEVDGVACLDVVHGFAMPHIKRAREQIEKLAACMLMRAGRAALLDRQKLGEVGIELSVWNVITQTLKVVRRSVSAGLRQTHALIAAMNAEKRLRLRIEEVAQVFGED